MTAPASCRSLVLSGSIGSGHDSVSAACAEALESAGAEVDTLDCMAMLGDRNHRLGERVFRTILDWSPVYDAFHFSGLRAGARFTRTLDAEAAKRIVPAIEARLPAGADGGLLLGVFATGASAAARIARRRHEWRAVVLCTDAAAHRMWVHDGIDRYLVSSPSVAATVRGYDPDADIVSLPPPVRQEFFNAPTQWEARAELGISESVPCVLLTAGGWGRGPLVEIACRLADAGVHVLALAGGNAAAYRRLCDAAAELPGSPGRRISPIAVTDQMPLLMAAADVIVTAAGQACHEARVVQRPLVLLDVVAGHGRENLLLELTKGGATASTGDPETVAKLACSVIDHGVSPADDWPVTSAEEWHKLFLASISDLFDPHPTPWV